MFSLRVAGLKELDYEFRKALKTVAKEVDSVEVQESSQGAILQKGHFKLQLSVRRNDFAAYLSGDAFFPRHATGIFSFPRDAKNFESVFVKNISFERLPEGKAAVKFARIKSPMELTPRELVNLLALLGRLEVIFESFQEKERLLDLLDLGERSLQKQARGLILEEFRRGLENLGWSLHPTEDSFIFYGEKPWEGVTLRRIFIER